MAEMLEVPSVSRANGDQCQYGPKAPSGALVKKPTGWLSSTRPGGGAHVTASGKVAREAAVYPFKLCRDILKGCMRQLQADSKLQQGIHCVQCLWEDTADEVLAMTGRWSPRRKPFGDSVTRQPLL